MKNVNVTHPGSDGNPGRRMKKAAQNPENASRHTATHPKRQARRARAYARGGQRPKGES